MNDIKRTVPTAGGQGGQRFAQQHHQPAVYFNAGPLAYLHVIDHKPAASSHQAEADSKQNVQKHFADQRLQQQFEFATSSSQNSQGSPNFSDSTLSNCDRDLDLGEPCPARPDDPRSTSARNSTGGPAAQATNDRHHHPHQAHPSTANNQPSRCNSASGASQPHRGVRKRVMANERERERTKSLNQALEILRNRLPVTEAEKRSKIQTLRVAKEYIEFLAKSKYISQLEQPHQEQQPQFTPGITCSEQGQYDAKPPSLNKCSLPQHQQQLLQQVGPEKAPLESPLMQLLTYKFYKFRLKSRSRGD